MSVVLRPNQDAALVVVVLCIDLIHIQEGEEDIMDDDVVGFLETLIDVDGPYDSLQRVAIGRVGGDVVVHPHHLRQPELAGQVVEAVAVDELGAHPREHPFRFEGIFVVKEIGYNGPQDSVTKVLEPLVVEAAADDIVGRN